ncbi:MAG TPA: hypothetical protein VFV88_02810 [Steroidobacteraceae bacterium]|nr:hypothetical protein [Steroidobacteraceae bacterium]
MRSNVLIGLLAATLLAACGAREAAAPSKDAPSHDAAAIPALASLPATVEGFLEWDDSVGEDEEDNQSRGLGETSMGTLKVGETELFVEAETQVLQAAGIPVKGAQVRATLGSKEGDDNPIYLITAVTRL